MAALPGSPHYAQVVSEIVALAHDFLAARVGAVELARRLSALGFELGADRDEPFLWLRGIDSESDAFPLGSVRDHWSHDALVREDAKRLAYEESVGADVREACVRLLARYGSGAV